MMNWIWAVLLGVSVVCGALSGRGKELGQAVMAGSQAGVTLAVSMAGGICLWTGVGKLMQASGITGKLAKLLGPILYRVFPSAVQDRELAGDLSANICANLLGLGNAATPMGIRAAQRLAAHDGGNRAPDELCRLIVLNTASIQLIPATVAAVRGSLGCSSPFDILPAVWVTSFASAGLGVAAAVLLGKVWRK
jgi:spore maturation protein A